MASSAEILLEEQLNNSVDNIVSEVNKIAENRLNEQQNNYQLNNQTNFSSNHNNLINNNHNSVAISSDQVTSSRQQQQGIENQIFQKNHNNNNNLDITNNNNINFSKEDIIYLHNNQGNSEQNYNKFPHQLGEFKTKISEGNTSLIGEGQNYQSYQQQGLNRNYQLFQNMPKSNEPIKLVYPITSNPQQQHQHHTAQQTQVSIVTMNNNASNEAGNRVTFTNQSLPNGAINLASQAQQQIMHAVSASGIQNTGTTIKTISAGAGGVGQQQQNQIVNSTSAGTTIQTLVIKNQPVSLSAGLVSSAPGMVTMTKTINQGNQQNIVATPTMIPASVQIVGMRPGTPTQNQQKTVAALSPRVVIGGPHMVGTRPASPAITLSALQNLHSGQSGPALILKTENGQYQLVRVTPPTAPPVATAATQNITNAGNQTIRLQTVPAQQTIATSSANLVVNSVSSANSTQSSLVAQQNSNVQHNTVATVAQVPALAQASHHPQTQHHQQQHQQVQIQQQNATTVSGTTQTTPNSVTQGNTKEKCRKFLANLIELSSREPKPVERNVRTLIQELIDANVEPEEFCDRLERLLNASPQPCLIGFLKKSLPLLRQSLFTKELVIEGIKPPPQNVVGMIGSTTLSTQLPKIQAQIRPISQQTTTIGQTQVRMVTPVPRPMGHTTITKQIGSGVRIQGPVQTSTATTTGQRLMNAQIRPVNASSGSTALVQGGSIQSPAGLQPVSGNQTIYSPSQNVVQIRASNAINRSPATLHIRATTPSAPRAPAPTIKNVGTTAITHVKVGQTQIKQIPAQQQNAIIHPPPISSNVSSVSSSNNIQINANANANLSNSTNSNNKLVTIKAQIVNKPPSKDKEKKQSAASSAALFQQSAISMSSASMEMDDINDVAAMGGVNLLEESQRILGSTEMIGTQIRSCKDEVFLNLPALQSRIRTIVAEKGLEEPSQEVAVLISHACQERLKNIVEKLAVIAEHRIDIIKMDPRYEITKDVRGQIKFLEELDKAEAKRHEEQEREMLLRAAKSRAKTEDPEQAKLKAKAKEMQRAEMEELRQRDANMTALQAIGPRKKPKLDGDATVISQTGVTGLGNSNISTTPLRPRIKRVNLRDMIFFMEQERDLCRSTMLYKTYLK